MKGGAKNTERISGSAICIPITKKSDLLNKGGAFFTDGFPEGGMGTTF